MTKVNWALVEVKQQLKTKGTTLTSEKYRAQLDATLELNTERAMYIQALTGVIRWLVELGSIDIMVAVSILSSPLMAPKVGHLEQDFHLFSYFNIHNNSRLIFATMFHNIDDAHFTDSDWTQFSPMLL